MKSVWLMYHDVYDTSPDPALPRSATMYHVSKATLREHFAAVRNSGRTVASVGQYLEGRGGDSVVITFDDGWQGSVDFGLSALKEFGWTAALFVTRDFIGKRGFVTDSTIREAADAGMEIGVHGTTHRMLSGCTREEVVSEFRICREHLESVVGRSVTLASLPGGDMSDTIVECAREAGLRSVCTSRPGINRKGTSPFHLRRIGIKDTTTGTEVARYCRYQLRPEVLRWAAFQIPRAVLGMKNYSKLRRRLLGERENNNQEVFRP